jgi:hypothetical protein
MDPQNLEVPKGVFRFKDLPLEVQVMVLRYIHPLDLASFARTSRHSYQTTFYFKDYNFGNAEPYDFVRLARNLSDHASSRVMELFLTSASYLREDDYHLLPYYRSLLLAVHWPDPPEVGWNQDQLQSYDAEYELAQSYVNRIIDGAQLFKDNSNMYVHFNTALRHCNEENRTHMLEVVAQMSDAADLRLSVFSDLMKPSISQPHLYRIIEIAPEVYDPPEMGQTRSTTQDSAVTLLRRARRARVLNRETTEKIMTAATSLKDSESKKNALLGIMEHIEAEDHELFKTGIRHIGLVNDEIQKANGLIEALDIMRNKRPLSMHRSIIREVIRESRLGGENWREQPFTELQRKQVLLAVIPRCFDRDILVGIRNTDVRALTSQPFKNELRVAIGIRLDKLPENRRQGHRR